MNISNKKVIRYISSEHRHGTAASLHVIQNMADMKKI